MSTVQELECYRSGYQNAKAKSGWEQYDHTSTDVVATATDLCQSLKDVASYKCPLSALTVYLKLGGKREVASALLLLRSTHKALDTAIHSGYSSEQKVEQLKQLSELMQTIQAKLDTLA